MNNSVKTLLLAAAGTGLMSGTAAAQPISQSAAAVTVARMGRVPDQAGLAGNNWGRSAGTKLAQSHSCKGQNMCKGQGGCKTSDMGCKAKNTCKGKGGCAVS
jgi:hypothetical protein